jgi:antitoxin HicB
MNSRFTYPFNLTGTPHKGWEVKFPDFPEFNNERMQARTLEDCAKQIDSYLEQVVTKRIVDALDIPTPSEVATQGFLPKVLPAPSKIGLATFSVTLKSQILLKASLCMAVAEKGITKVALAKLLGVNEAEVRRILDPRHGTKLPTLERALKELGKRIHIEVVDDQWVEKCHA